MRTEMKRVLRAVFAAGFLLAFQAAPANANPIYNNGAAYYDNGLCAQYSTVDVPSCPGTWTVFDDFELSSSTTLTDIFWTAVLYGDPDFSDQEDPYPGSSELIDIRAWIYDVDPMSGLTPPMPLHEIPAQVGDRSANVFLNSLYGADIFYEVQLTLLNIDLEPGMYWLGMQHRTHGGIASVACVGDDDVNFCGSESGNSTQWQDVDGAVVRSVIGNEHAFRLEGNIAAVPDSGTLAPLVGLVWAAMFVWRRQA